MHSIYQDFTWQPGTIYRTLLGDVYKQGQYYKVEKGFHSCKGFFYDRLRGNYYWNYVSIDSYSNRVVDAIIPKGSEYYVDNGVYVSNQLIIMV